MGLHAGGRSTDGKIWTKHGHRGARAAFGCGKYEAVGLQSPWAMLLRTAALRRMARKTSNATRLDMNHPFSSTHYNVSPPRHCVEFVDRAGFGLVVPGAPPLFSFRGGGLSRGLRGSGSYLMEIADDVEVGRR